MQAVETPYLWYTMRQSTYGTALDIHGFREQVGGVLDGQTIKCFIDTAPDEETARARFPDIKFGSKWTDPQISYNHLRDDSFTDDYDD